MALHVSALHILGTITVCFCHIDPPPAVSYVKHKSITVRLDRSVSLAASETHMEGDVPLQVWASWNHLPVGAVDAWVGLYLAEEDASQVVPLKYNFCNRSLLTGMFRSSGRLSFRILNYRADVVFRLFLGWESPVLIAESQRIVVRTPSYPTGVRLALTNIPGEVAITWTSTREHAKGAGVNYTIIDQGGRVVKHDVAPVSNMVSYDRMELCGAPADAEGFREPGMFYTSRIGQIQPGSHVMYRVGSKATWSRTFSFRAPPGQGSAVKVFAFGDLGEHPRDDSAQGQGEPWYTQEFAYGDPGVHNTTIAMQIDHQHAPADLVLHNGDLSYAMGYSSMWEVFHDNIESLSTQIPWMVTMGNHERDWPGTNSTSFGENDSMGECGVPTMRRFAAHPFASRRLPPNDGPWYTLSLGVVAIIAISTEHSIALGSDQYAWLKSKLDGIDRQATPWVVLAGHRPYVVDSAWPGDQDFAEHFQHAVGDLLDRHNVDLVIGGHHHSYQRSCPLRGRKCSPDGTVILNVGMAGAGLNDVNETMPEIFLRADDKHFGYCRISADKQSLTAEYVLSASHKVHDFVVLRKATDETLYS